MVHITITATSDRGIAAIKQHVDDTEKLSGKEKSQMKTVIAKHEVAKDCSAIYIVPSFKIRSLMYVVVQGKVRKKEDLKDEWEKKLTALMLENGATRDIDYTLEVLL